MGYGTIKLALKRIPVKYVIARESTVEKVHGWNQAHWDKDYSFVINAGPWGNSNNYHIGGKKVANIVTHEAFGT